MAKGKQADTGEATSKSQHVCAKCGEAMHGQFVRAVGQTWHMDHFRCGESFSFGPQLALTPDQRTATRP